MKTRDTEFIERWLDCPAGELPWEQLLDLTKETLNRLAAAAEEALDRIPPRLHAELGDLATERGRWERLAAELCFLLEGDGEELHTILTRMLFSARPGSPLRLVRFLHDSGDGIALGAVGRMVLDQPDCPDRVTIQALVDTLSREPEGWEKALDEYLVAADYVVVNNRGGVFREAISHSRVRGGLKIVFENADWRIVRVAE